MKIFIPLQLLVVFTLTPVASAQEVITAALNGVPMIDKPDYHLVLNNNYSNGYDVDACFNRQLSVSRFYQNFNLTKQNN